MLKVLLLFVAMAMPASKIYSQEEAVYEDVTIKKKTYHLGISGAVDLGLSVKWATHNVGAEKPYEDGEHYAWGENEDKSESFYDWRSYKDLIDGDLSHFKKYREGGAELLNAEDDVAHTKMGGSWHMPTKEEMEELLYKCKWKWTTYNKKRGYIVIGKTGNAIFLPAAGYFRGTFLNGWDTEAKYWSKTRTYYSPVYAYHIYFHAGGARWNYEMRFVGMSVRAVCPK